MRDSSRALATGSRVVRYLTGGRAIFTPTTVGGARALNAKGQVRLPAVVKAAHLGEEDLDQKPPIFWKKLGVGLTTQHRKNTIVTNAQTTQPRNTDGSRQQPMQLTRTKRNKNGQKMKIGTWNVRTMLMPGKMQEIARELGKHKYDVVALQEIRWKGEGEIRKKDFTIFYSGNEKRTGRAGTGFYVASQTMKNFIGFEPVNERMCKLRLRGKFRNITIVAVYAPTEEADEGDKQLFYDQLAALVQKIPTYDLTVVLGDCNAKLGKEAYVTSVGGAFSLHDESNENGKLLAQFAAENQMVLKSTCFPHKKIHLGTWKIPGTNRANQIDHVMVLARHESSITQVQASRGPNCDSDHYLVKVILTERLANAQRRKPRARKRWNLGKFSDEEIKKDFQEEVSRKLAQAKTERSEEPSIEEMWQEISGAILDTTKEIIGESKPKDNEWYDDECQAAMEEKNKARMKLLKGRATRRAHEEYNEKKIYAYRLCRRKKREMVNTRLREIDENHEQNRARLFYKGIDYFRKDYKPKLTGCKSKDGVLLGEEGEVLARWTEHYRELLNKESGGSSREGSDVQTAELNLEKPTLLDVQTAMKRMKNRKAPGEDNITAEMLKNAGPNVEVEVHNLVAKIWEAEVMPKSWNVGLIASIYKKGDKLVCDNYRGITLLNIAYKVFSNILLKNLSKYTEEIIGEYQGGFRRARGTVDQIFVVRQSLEKCYEHSTDLHMLFVDFRQAFDSVLKNRLFGFMEEKGIPKKLVRLTKMTMQNASAKVIVDGRCGEEFSLSRGVRQGDALSATLFNLALQAALEGVVDTGMIVYKSKHICAYADDIVIIATREDQLKETFALLNTNAKQVGLEVNSGKTKYMVVSPNPRLRKGGDLVVDDMIFANVETFNYLGAEINSANKISNDVSQRLTAANRAFYANLRLLKSRIISKATKMKIYKTLIRPVLTYGAETWNISTADATRLRVFERKIVRRIQGPVFDNGYWRIRNNDEIDGYLQQEDVVRFIKAQRLRWLGHVERMASTRMPKRILQATMTGRRQQGRPRNRWKDEVTADLRTMRVRNWKAIAEDRQEWRSVVEQAKTHTGL